MLRRVAGLLVLPVVLAALALGAVSANAAGDPDAAGFVSRANAARQARGLRPYAVAADLAAVARRHSARMAAQQSLHHNPRLGSEVSGWRVVGENVGTGASVDSIHTAFMNSPTHRANIVATDYLQIGVGTVTDPDGQIWVTQVFRLPSAAPRVTPPSASRASRSVARPPVVARRTVPRPAAKPVVVRPAAPAAPAAPVPADAGEIFTAAISTALAPGATGALGQALSYTGTMAALAR